MILIVGHIVVPLVLLVETELRAALLGACRAVAAAHARRSRSVLLQPVKGAIVAWQWAHRMHGFDPNAEHDGDETPMRLSERNAMTDLAERLDRRLSAIRPAPMCAPRDAATLILIDRGGAGAQGAAGAAPSTATTSCRASSYFPGGRVEASDGRMPSARPLRSSCVEARLMRSVERPSAAKARGFALAAIRETFEETGLLLGARDETPAPSRATRGTASQRRGVHARSRRRCISSPAPSRRRGRPRRFDTRFFAVDAGAIARAARRHRRPGRGAGRAGLAADAPKPGGSTCRPSPPSCWRSSRPASRPGSATTCRCRSIGS